MFSLPSFRIGRFFGIPIEINLSWVIIFALVSGLLSFEYFPALQLSNGTFPFQKVPFAVSVVAGIVTALLFFVSVLLHELSHSLVARSLGMKITSVTLFLFGGVSQIEDEPASPRDEFLMATAGPAMSILLAVALFFVWDGMALGGVSALLWAPLQYLSLINLIVGVFNLLPAFPLDGGRVLRSMLWAGTHDLLKATRWAARSGQFFGWTFVVVAVVGGVAGGAAYLPNFIWLGLIGWFLASMASGSYQAQVVKTQLASVTVDQVASRPAVVVPGEETIEQIVVEHMIGGRHGKYPVVEDGRLVGILSLNRAKALPRERWAVTTAADLAEGDLRMTVVPYSEPLERALQKLEPGHPGMLVVERDGMLDGVVTRSDVLEVLRRASISEASRT